MASEEEAQAAPKEQEAPAKEEPETSRVVMLTGIGGLNKVEIRTVTKPKPTEGQVLIKVHAWYNAPVYFSCNLFFILLSLSVSDKVVRLSMKHTRPSIIFVQYYVRIKFIDAKRFLPYNPLIYYQLFCTFN